jgi:NTE family protein
LSKLQRLARSVRAFTREFTRDPSEPPGTPAKKNPTIGLALGGGFARGLAHIGVLKVFAEENIPIHVVGGTSVGAVIGAAYCSGVSAKEMEEIAALVRFKDFARWTLSRYGLASNDRMSGFLERVLKVKTFEELRLPLAISATDFVSGEAVVFRSGPLVDPVRASCAYPGMFLPVNVNGRLMVDGLLAHAVPTVPLREMGADRVIAVYLSAHWVNAEGPRHIFDVIGQCFSIAQQKMCGLWQAAADVVIQPDVRGFGYDEFERGSALIRAGEDAAREALPVIRTWLGEPAEAPQVAASPAPNPVPQPAQVPVSTL